MIHLAVGRLEIDWGKNNGFSDHSALFQGASDVAEVPYYYAGDKTGSGEWEVIVEFKEGLAKPLFQVADRLELLGYTLAVCRQEFEMFAELNGFDDQELSFDQLSAALLAVDISGLSADYGEGGEDFGKFFRREIAPRIGLGAAAQRNSCVAEGMENLSPQAVLRLLTENPTAQDLPVMWAYADVEEDGGWARREEFVKGLDPTDQFLIVTEGSSDLAILRHAFKLLRPHIADFFTFVDMEEGYPFSGAGNLVRFIQGLVSIRIQNNVVAVFDNDAEGVASFTRCSSMNIPPNIRVLKLPDVDIFRAFETIGPSGAAISDINGRAVAIECFLDVGTSARVRWTSFNQAAQSYQGELDGKEAYARAFLRQTRRDANYDYSKLDSLLDEVIATCVDIREQAERRRLRD